MSAVRKICPVWTFFGQEGRGISSDGRPHFLVQKTSDFSKFMVCSRGQGGRSQFFAILCGRPSQIDNFSTIGCRQNC